MYWGVAVIWMVLPCVMDFKMLLEHHYFLQYSHSIHLLKSFSANLSIVLCFHMAFEIQ